MDSEDLHEIHLAVMGLATIGTEEAIALVFSLDPSKNKTPLKPARWNFEHLNFNERR